MANSFNLPAVGDTMVEAQVAEWFVAVGDTVVVDQLICALDTDKSTVEMTTPYAGVVLNLGGAIGETIEVGRPLIVVGDAGELGAPNAVDTSSEATTDAPAAPANDNAQDSNIGGANGNGTVRSPIVRNLAQKLNVDLASVTGSGPGGVITRRDVETAATANPASRPPATASMPVQRVGGPVRAMPKVRREARMRGIDLATLAGTGPDGAVRLADLERSAPVQERRIPLSPVRRAIGAHLTESVTTIPQFTSMVDVDASALMETRERLRTRFDAPLPIDALIMALLVPVLREHPKMNARLEADAREIVLFDRFDLGVAVDTPDGLLVPVVSDVGARDLASLSAEITRLATAARDRSIRPEELSGATCTLNNVGAVGLEAGTPILPLGTTAIIAPGRARPNVRLRDGQPIAVPTMTISATFDHRVVDGGDAGRFLTQLRDHLEVPALGLL